MREVLGRQREEKCCLLSRERWHSATWPSLSKGEIFFREWERERKNARIGVGGGGGWGSRATQGSCWGGATGCDSFKKSQHVNQKHFGLNGCVLADVSKAAAAMSTGMMFTIMGRGSPISRNMEAQGATFLASLAPDLKRDELENNTNSVVRGSGKKASASDAHQTQFHLGRALVKTNKYHTGTFSHSCFV